ncbi:tRNA threonylcarbamoyladenosine dehydratase [Chromatium okenii]|jgi:tRNA A37 threonylcarbamoyladenosine dehydratase|uniref:tRNA threonylcarbamoyladenosine dehydratase n=1 Tax=Chromatium okenii TaxID=61644 RepID=A0A2S7XN91_9GAMM|nr:tRNA threonylcarbamoyladenosine dehydratase [Chromatium okenii]PQJ95209.1 tRNA threonylcarbamoyladenosine dehydratase [Chromatium okenii]
MTNHEPLYERTRILVGDAGIERLRSSRVLIAGLGGVGAFAAEALARAGVGALTLADHDHVAASNLNRQLVALHSTLAQRKTAVMAERIVDINPACQVTRIDEFLAAGDIENLLIPNHFDHIIDAIDSLNSKLALLETALQRGIPIVSSMGAGGRLDPTRVRVGDIAETRICPLAREVRQRLRRRGITAGLTVVWSDEQPHPAQPPEETGRGRPRAVNGSISYLPSLFGLMLAGITVQRLLTTA